MIFTRGMIVNIKCDIHDDRIRRQEHAKDKIPSGFQALHATGDGNCLFNSASILLFGSEGYSVHLRLSTVIHAVDHFDHYLKMVSRQVQ